MTRGAAATLRTWSVPIAIAVLGIVITVNFLLLIPTVHEGQKARTTQCEREPIFRKLVVAGAHYHLLNALDVATFERTAPDCAKPRR